MLLLTEVSSLVPWKLQKNLLNYHCQSAILPAVCWWLENRLIRKCHGSIPAKNRHAKIWAVLLFCYFCLLSHKPNAACSILLVKVRFRKQHKNGCKENQNCDEKLFHSLHLSSNCFWFCHWFWVLVYSLIFLFLNHQFWLQPQFELSYFDTGSIKSSGSFALIIAQVAWNYGVDF